MFHNANCSSRSLKDQEDLPAEEMELEETRGEHKRGVQPAATARGKLSPSVIYSLLGVTTLLFVLTLGIAVILMAQMLSEKQMSDSGFRVEYSQANDQLYCAVEWTRFKQNCYHFSTKANGWVEAQRSCASADAHLVVINNAEEQAFIRKALPDQMHWIGLSDMVHAGDWRWVDGTDYFSSVKFWTEGEPNSPQYERCVETYSNGMWNDRQCNVHRHWICEKPASTTPPSTLQLP